MKDLKKSILILSFLGIVAYSVYQVFHSMCWGLGCTGGYEFTRTVLYHAPKSHIMVNISSRGFVPEGHDGGDGHGQASLWFTQKCSDTLRLFTSPENIDSIIYLGQAIPLSCSQLHKEVFYEVLDSLGYEGLDLNEMNELRDCITLLNYGPKIGKVKGQTSYIEILEDVSVP